MPNLTHDERQRVERLIAECDDVLLHHALKQLLAAAEAGEQWKRERDEWEQGRIDAVRLLDKVRDERDALKVWRDEVTCKLIRGYEPGGLRFDEVAGRIERLCEDLKQERAVCLCGCEPSNHENYGEDGESCEDESHECLRVAPAVLGAVNRLRAENAELARLRPLAEAGERMQEALESLTVRAESFAESAYQWPEESRPKDIWLLRNSIAAAKALLPAERPAKEEA